MLGHEIQGNRNDSRGDKVWTKKNQLTTRLITNQTTADDPSDYDKERTRRREKFAPVAAGGGDGQEKCITSGAYHLEITADGSNTKIIYESTALDDL